jgi:hypothetical protein
MDKRIEELDEELTKKFHENFKDHVHTLAIDLELSNKITIAETFFKIGYVKCLRDKNGAKKSD